MRDQLVAKERMDAYLDSIAAPRVNLFGGGEIQSGGDGPRGGQ